MKRETVFFLALTLASFINTPLQGQNGWLPQPLNPPEEMYRLSVRIDTVGGILEADGSILINNSSSLELDRLAFYWADNAAQQMTVILEGKEFELDGRSSEPQVLALQSPLWPRDELEIGIRFKRSLPDSAERHELPFVNWHPRLWWGYEAHGTYDVELALPAGWIASTSARRDPSDGHYRAQHIRTFGLHLCQSCEVIEMKAGETHVRVPFPEEYRDLGKVLAENAVDAVKFYREKFGFYPQPQVTIIPGEPPPVSGGFPFATAMFAIHGLQPDPRLRENHWKWIVAHELGHQYWLEHVLPREPEVRWGWLMIGLGIMADRDYCRARGLDEFHPQRLERYADTVRGGLDTTVELTAGEIRDLKYDYNSRVTHDKAYGILSGLSALVGRETFGRIEVRCLREFAGRRLGSTQFRRIVEEETHQDWGWFFGPLLKTNQYASCETAVTEEVRIAEEIESKILVTHKGSFRIPVPVEVRFEDGTRVRRWADRLSEKQVLAVRSKTPIAEVIVDPDRELPLVIPPPIPGLQTLSRELTESPWTGVGARALDWYKTATELGLKDNRLLLKLSLLLYDGKHYEQALENFKRMAATITQPEEQVVEFYIVNAWQGILLDLLGEREKALDHYQEALSTNLDPQIKHSQYNLVLDRKFVQERLEKPFERE